MLPQKLKIPRSHTRYRATGEFSTIQGHPQRYEVEVQGVTLMVAAGRAARLARKTVRGKFTQMTMTLETLPNE